MKNCNKLIIIIIIIIIIIVIIIIIIIIIIITLIYLCEVQDSILTAIRVTFTG